MVPAKNKYADSKSSAYLRGTWLKTKKYQTVILAYLRYVSTRIIDPAVIVNFFCVGVMYSGEYDVCDVTLSVYPHRASLKNMPGHGGNRTHDLWNTSPMLCQLSYAPSGLRPVWIFSTGLNNIQEFISSPFAVLSVSPYFFCKSTLFTFQIF